MGRSPFAANSAARRVLWLPSLPSEGSLSMDRYWKELEHQRRARPPAGLELSAVLPELPGESRRAERFSRNWHKYVSYPWRVRRLAPQADLVHVLDHTFARLLGQVPAGVRTVATVHDLAPLVVPGSLTAGQQERFRRTVSWLCRADLVISDSEYTAQDVIRLLGCDEKVIRVLPLGADLAQFRTRQAAPLPDWDQRFAGRAVIVSVGSVGERKNLAMLPDFLARLQAAGQPVDLVRIGDTLPAALAEKIRGVLSDTHWLELGKVSAEHLAGAYQRAAMLVFPSQLEGYGLPVIEALAAGCPVVCSNASSLPEVGGDAALYFNYEDTELAVAHATRLLADAPFRQERRQTGLAWSDRFSWEAHFTALTALYSEVLDSAPRPGK